MAIKQQKKAGGSAKKAGKPAAKAMPKKAGTKQSGRVSAPKVKPSKAKVPAKRGAQAPVAPKTQKKPVTAAKKPSPKKPAAQKAPSAKTAKKGLPKKTEVKKSVLANVKEVKSVSAAPVADQDHRFNKKDLAQFRDELLTMRERITGQSGAMRHAALQRNDEVNLEEEGTDAFIRLQTLAQVGTQQQNVASIDEALRAIEKGTYGLCDMCGALVSKSRLKVLPFAKNCIKCQSEIEQKRYQVGRR